MQSREAAQIALTTTHEANRTSSRHPVSILAHGKQNILSFIFPFLLHWWLPNLSLTWTTSDFTSATFGGRIWLLNKKLEFLLMKNEKGNKNQFLYNITKHLRALKFRKQNSGDSHMTWKSNERVNNSMKDYTFTDLFTSSSLLRNNSPGTMPLWSIGE